MRAESFPKLIQPEPGKPVDRLRQIVRKYRIISKIFQLRRLPGKALRACRAYLRLSVREWLRDAGLTNPARLLPQMRFARRSFSDRLFLAQSEALLIARSAGWSAAAPMFRQIAARAEQGRPLKGATAQMLLAPSRPSPAVKLAMPVANRPVHLPPEIAERIIVYTACFEGRPLPPPIFGVPDGLRFLCFTDRKIVAPGWEIVPTDATRGGDEFHRICPHKVLANVAPRSEWSLYIAPDRLAVGNLHTLFTRWLLPQHFALWRHAHCIDWHDLAERHLVMESASTEAVLAQALACTAEVLPRNRGVCDTGVLWRRHTDTVIAALMEAWWALENESPGADDITLYRLLHGARAPTAAPAILPAALGQAEDNIFFARYSPNPNVRQLVAAPALRTGRIPVAFLYSGTRPNESITLLRGRQLSRMIAARFPDLYDVSFTPDISSVRDQVVIVNRGAIKDNTSDSLAALKKRNNILISDWQDLPLHANKCRIFDAHMALSLRQAVDLNRLYPETPVFHVTHHVNPDVPSCTPPADRLRTVYFGFLPNTVRPNALAGSVDLVSVRDTTFDAQSWRDVAPKYNCHWIVRKISKDEWRKPFLKGFVAARCGAVVIVTRDDMNAAHYLGDDYPFYAESHDLDELEMTWIRVAAAFGGPDWNMALEIMRQVGARSTDAQVCNEFQFMMKEMLG